nr:hypothetical protein [Planctomycetota bacterium]
MSDRVLDISTSGTLRGLPGLRRIAWERRESGEGYHARPGEWPFTQITVQITLAGAGVCWPHGRRRRGQSVPVPAGAALVYDSRLHRQLEYGQAPAQPWEFLYVNLLGSASAAIIADLAAVHHHAVPIAPSHPEIVALLNLVPRSGHRLAPWSWQRAAQIAQRLLLALSPREPQAGDQVSADDRLVAEAMRRWRDDLARALPVGEIARQL